MNKWVLGRKSMLHSLIAFFLILLMPLQAWAATVEPMSVSGGKSSISVSGTTVVYGGYTSSPVLEDAITVVSYLQRYQGTTWITVDCVSLSVCNSAYVSIAKAVTVAGGYYYRTKSYHQSNTDDVVLGFYSYSIGQWVP